MPLSFVGSQFIINQQSQADKIIFSTITVYCGDKIKFKIKQILRITRSQIQLSNMYQRKAIKKSNFLCQVMRNSMLVVLVSTRIVIWQFRTNMTSKLFLCTKKVLYECCISLIVDKCFLIFFMVNIFIDKHPSRQMMLGQC